MMTEYYAGGLVPAAVIVLVGTVVRARQAGEKLARRWLFFLFSASVLLLGTQFLVYRWEKYELAALLQPAAVGALIALIVHLVATPELWSRETIWITLLIVMATVALLAWWWAEMDPFLTMIGVVTAMTWQASGWQGKRRRLAYLGLLLLLLIVVGWTLSANDVLANSPRWLYRLLGVGYLFVWPIVAVVLAARLIQPIMAGEQPSNWLVAAGRLALAALLLLLVGDQVVTETVWVIAEDSLSVIPVIVFVAATAAGMLLAWQVPGWRRVAALVFALLVMLTVSYASGRGWQTSPTAMTEAWAARIDRVIQRYHEREGDYPSSLADLTPFYLWRIPQPMIFRDQTWCYEGGDDYYRLGYVHQPAFGVPLEYITVRIHAAVGEPPESSWPCDDALEKAHSQSHWQ
jgi:hypothetical protein